MYFFVRTQNPLQDEAEMRDLLEHDPAKGLLHYEIFPMPRAVVGTLRP